MWYYPPLYGPLAWSFRTADYILPENLTTMEDDREDPAYDNGFSPQASNVLDLSVPLDSLRNDVRSYDPDLPQPRVIPPSQPTSLGLGQYSSTDCTTNNNLPLSPALTKWMEFHTSVLQGQGHLGHPGTTIPKGTIPKDAYPRIRPVPSAVCQHPLPSSGSPGVLVSGVRGPVFFRARCILFLTGNWKSRSEPLVKISV